MRFKLDENLPRAARPRLAAHGWDVHDVYEEQLAGADDAAVQAACEREQRILITLDTDFADTRRYDPARSAGVIVLRPTDQSIRGCLQCLDDAIRALAAERIHASLWIVEPQRIRTEGQLGSLVTADSGCFNGGRCSPTPTEVSGGYRWREISASERHACGITLNAEVYCWGSRLQWRLGRFGGTEVCENHSAIWKDQPCSSTPVRIRGIRGIGGDRSPVASY